jgi:prepilin-type N-terminal cleavage/methylation domain-containing protein
MKHKNKSKQRGFSLVEVLIAAGLLSIISYGLMSLITNATKQQKSIVAKDAMRELTGEIRNVLSDSIACTKTFGGNDFTISTGADPEVKVNHIKDALNNDKYSVDSNYFNELLKLKAIKLEKLIIDVGSSPVTGVAKLNLTAEKLGDIQGSRTTHQVISIKVTFTPATNTILDCVSMSASSESLWKLATNMTDIYFNAGNVGIGTSTPSAALHVTGPSIRIDRPIISAVSGPALDFYNGTNQIGQVVSVQNGVNGSLLMFYTKTSGGTLGSPKMVIDNLGKVGIGTTNPLAKLHLEGPAAGMVIRSTTDVDHALSLYNSTTTKGWNLFNLRSSDIAAPNGFLIEQYDGVTAHRRFVINDSGNVGIGTSAPAVKLDVIGKFRPGAQTLGTACAATEIGAQGYNSATGAPMHCNGTNWISSGGGLSGYYKCPLEIPNPPDHECENHCIGQITDQPTCKVYFDNGTSSPWACYGVVVKACTLIP